MKTIYSQDQSKTAQKDFWQAMSTLMAFQKQAPPLIPVDHNGAIPLSYSQERLWLLDQLQSGEFSAYNQPLGFKIEGKLNITALEKSLNTIIKRHEVLRTNFVSVNGKPTQVINPEIVLNLSVIDLRGLPESDRLNQARQLLTEEAQKPFNLSEDPLLRGKLVQLAEDEYFFLLTIHHVVTDAWSKGVLFQELAELYKVFSQDQPSPLPELPIQYADFAIWQRQWLQEEFGHTLLDYWQQQLDNQPDHLYLPLDTSETSSLTRRSALQELVLGQKLTKELKVLSRNQGVTLFATLLAAFYVLLYRYSEQDDLFVCSPIANRNHPKIKGLIGYFSNLLILRTHLNSDSSCQEFLNQVSKVISGGYAHQDLPVQELINSLDLPGFSLSQVMFALQNTTIHTLDLLDLTVSNVDFDNGIADFDLYLSLQEKVGSLVGVLKYNTDLFQEGTIKEMLHHYQIILENLVSNPEQSLSQLLPLTEKEAFRLRQKREKVQQLHRPDKSNYIAPRNPVEVQLTQIWQKVLGIKSIGVRDNFFDLGGKSLLAVGLFAEIERTFGKNLPLSTLFKASTIEQIANILGHSEWSAPWSSLVLIKSGNSKPPLFCIHAVGPSILNYRNLTPYLDPKQPVYGLQAQGLDGNKAPLTRIEDMADHYIKEIRTIEPNGPYFLVGHSFGGLVAFEMARQLHAQNYQVGLLGLIDTLLKSGQNTPPLNDQLFIHRLNLSRLQPKQKLNYILERVQWGVERFSQKIKQNTNGWFNSSPISELPENYQLIEKADRQAAQDYVPQIYPGKIILFRSIIRPTKVHYQPYLGWRNMATDGVEIQEVPGDHLSMIQEPHVQVLAEKLKTCLDKAQNNQ